jgi:transposase
MHAPRQGGVHRRKTNLKEVVAEQALELRLLKKSMIADGGDEA